MNRISCCSVPVKVSVTILDQDLRADALRIGTQARPQIFARHIVLPEVGGAGQVRLAAARVAVIGHDASEAVRDIARDLSLCDTIADDPVAAVADADACVVPTC